MARKREYKRKGRQQPITQPVVESAQNTSEKTGGIVANVNKSMNKLANFKAIRTLGDNLYALNNIAIAVGAGFMTLEGAADYTDTFAKNMDGLDTMNQSLKGLAVTNDSVTATAMKSNSSYGTTMNLVTGLGTAEEGVFKNTQEVLDVTDQLNKRFAIAYMSEEEIAEASSTVVSAISDGVIDATEFESVMSSVPGAMQALMDSTGVSEQQLANMASQGQLTGEMFKSALLNSTQEVEAGFSRLPTTFGDVWNTIKGIVSSSVGPILQSLEPLFSSEGFQTLLTTVGYVMMIVVGLVSGGINLIADTLGFLLTVLAPFTPLLLLIGLLWVMMTIQMHAAAIASAVTSVAMKVLSVVTGILSGAMNALKFAFNNPAFLALAVVILLIAAVFLILKRNVEGVKDVLISVFTGIISFAEGVANVFIGIINLIISGINLILGLFGKKIELIPELDFSQGKENVKNFINDLGKEAENEKVNAGSDTPLGGGFGLDGDTDFNSLLGEDGQFNMDSLGDVEGLEGYDLGDYDLNNLDLNTDSLAAGSGDYSGYGFGNILPLWLFFSLKV